MIDALVTELRSLSGLEDLQPKYSESADQPFRRMLVRIKKEIIAFGVEGIDPGKRTSPKLKPQELKQWLDEGRPITLLDTRNDYEVELGTFRGALIPHIDHFRDFPAAVRALPELPEMHASHINPQTGEDEFASAAATLGFGPAEEVRERDPNDPTTWGKVGRNEVCPCGSGKKYKHCHGRFV